MVKIIVDPQTGTNTALITPKAEVETNLVNATINQPSTKSIVVKLVAVVDGETIWPLTRTSRNGIQTRLHLVQGTTQASKMVETTVAIVTARPAICFGTASSGFPDSARRLTLIRCRSI